MRWLYLISGGIILASGLAYLAITMVHHVDAMSTVNGHVFVGTYIRRSGQVIIPLFLGILLIRRGLKQR